MSDRSSDNWRFAPSKKVMAAVIFRLLACFNGKTQQKIAYTEKVFADLVYSRRENKKKAILH